MRSAIMVNDGVKVVKSSGKAVDKLDCPPDVQPPRPGPEWRGRSVLRFSSPEPKHRAQYISRI